MYSHLLFAICENTHLCARIPRKTKALLLITMLIGADAHSIQQDDFLHKRHVVQPGGRASGTGVTETSSVMHVSEHAGLGAAESIAFACATLRTELIDTMPVGFELRERVSVVAKQVDTLKANLNSQVCNTRAADYRGMVSARRLLEHIDIDGHANVERMDAPDSYSFLGRKSHRNSSIADVPCSTDLLIKSMVDCTLDSLLHQAFKAPPQHGAGLSKVPPRKTRRQRILFNCLTSYFLSIAMLYQMSPFFQPYAHKVAGASTSTVGVIYSMLPFASFVASFPAGILIRYIGERYALMFGLLLLACSSLAFGLSASVPAWLIWRALQGCATAPIYTSISCLLANTFDGPGEFEKVNGFMETISNIGFAVGPMLGGALFQYGGFVTPFAVTAAGHLLFVGLCAISPVEKQKSPDEPLAAEEEKMGYSIDSVNVRDVCYSNVLWAAGAGMLVPGIFGAIDPAISAHLQGCLGRISATTVGILVAIMSIPSSLLSPLVGGLQTTIPPPYIVIVGCLILGLCSAALGLTDPSVADLSPALGVKTGSLAQWMLQISVLLSLGVGSAIGWTPVLPSMMNTASKKVAEHRGASTIPVSAVSPPVSALFNAAAAAGEAAGPILGGGLIALIGFCKAYFLLGMLFFVYSIAFLVAYRRKRDSLRSNLLKRNSGILPQLRLRNAKGNSFDITVSDHESGRTRKSPS